MLRMLAYSGLDQVIPTFPTLYEAVQPAPAAAAQPGRGHTRLRALDSGSAGIGAAVVGVRDLMTAAPHARPAPRLAQAPARAAQPGSCRGPYQTDRQPSTALRRHGGLGKRLVTPGVTGVA